MFWPQLSILASSVPAVNPAQAPPDATFQHAVGVDDVDGHRMRALGTGVNSGQAGRYGFKDRRTRLKFKNFTHDGLTHYSMLFV